MSEENSWYDSLPEDLKSAPIFKPGEDGTVKSVEQVVLDLTNLTQVAGNSMRMPGPDADEEDMAKFQTRVMEKIPGLMVMPNAEDDDNVAAHFSKLGKPATPEEYKAPEIEGFEVSDIGAIKAQAHAMHMTQKQFSAYITNQAEAHKAATEGRNTKNEEEQNVIKTEWGAAFEQNKSVVGKLLKENKLTPKELVEGFDNGTLPASTMRYLLNMAELGAEDSTFQKQDEGGDVIPIPEEAQERLIEVEKQLFAKGMRPGKPEYTMLVNKRNKLMKQAYPDASLDSSSMRA